MSEAHGAATREGNVATATENATVDAEKKKKKKKGRVLRLFVKLALFAGVTWATFTYVLGWIRESENNMFPMIKSGDFCLYYRLGDAFIGDAVAYVDESGKTRLGRVVAIGGETVDFPKEGGYTLNGAMPAETIPYETYAAEKSDVTYPVELASDEFFILNDYRAETSDSRSFGVVKASAIKGKILFVLRRRSI